MSAALEVPLQWSKRRLRFDARLNPLKSKLDLPAYSEVSFVPMDAVGELGGLQLKETRPIEEVYNGYTYFADGDVCLAKITPCFENGKGALAQGLTKMGLPLELPSCTLFARVPALTPGFSFI
ncbi:hypothetical protein [Mesorhizobium caraganae]|uniref:hypothetical protein n=1 Tax=Mesorhizobium caraganae TaxID=483206 RepID=UPI001AEDE30C|nr:hypothetical protein [Mesorhizobium caraganae]